MPGIRFLPVAGLLVGVILVGFGSSEGQADDTYWYSRVICTSCLGIQEIAPELTFQEKAELQKVQTPIEITLVTGEYCPDCPRARDFLEDIKQVTNGIVSFVEVDQRILGDPEIRQVPSVIVGGKKLQGLGTIRNELIPSIIELSEEQI